jgi:AraC-like DNA-binding protein
MLHETGLMIADIAHQCGFKNQFHFAREVTECQGMSPRQLRNKAWGR